MRRDKNARHIDKIEARHGGDDYLAVSEPGPKVGELCKDRFWFRSHGVHFKGTVEFFGQWLVGDRGVGDGGRFTFLAF